MKRAALGLLLLVFSCLAGAQGFHITAFTGDLNLRKDGVLEVTERIDLIFDEPHHGIFRDIPVVYDSGHGFSRGINITGVSVTDASGRSLPAKVSGKSEDLDIRIGDKDQYAPVGEPLTYVIRYQSFGQMNWFDEDQTWQPYCELYWNVTGNEWQDAMDHVSFILHYPEVEQAKDVRARLYVGPYGSREYQEVDGVHPEVSNPQIGTAMILARGSLTGTLGRPLSPGEGLTLVLDLPSHAIVKPTSLQLVGMFVKANMGLTIPLIVIVVMFLMWLIYGKDPAKKPIAVQFEPPDGISGPEAGTLIDERVDQRDLAAGIISLAVKGYLTVTPEETGMIIKKRTATLQLTGKQAGPELSPFETTLLAKLQGAGTIIDEMALRTSVAPYLSELNGRLYDSMVDRGYYIANPDSVRTGWLIGGIVAVVLLGGLFFLTNPIGNALPSIIGGIVGAIFVAWFAMLMPRRTPQGADAQRKVAGFAEFIRRARGKELDWMSQKQPTASLFEEYLPHAIAFGLAVEWAGAFDGILHEMPHWYVTPYGTPFYPIYFGNDMVTIGNNLGAAAGTPPRSSGASGGSSGFGGGGFSGGGFGGGGGGSW